MIILAQRGKNNERTLAIENVNKTAITEILKKLSSINFNNKNNWAISYYDIDEVANLEFTSKKKYLIFFSKI